MAKLRYFCVTFALFLRVFCVHEFTQIYTNFVWTLLTRQSAPISVLCVRICPLSK